MGKKIILLSTCLSLFLSSLSAMSLRDSIEKTLTSNPDVMAERKNQDAFKLYVDEREGRYLPTLDIESYLESSREERKYDTGPNTDTTGRQDGYNAAIILRQYIYDGGATPSQVEETKHQDKANRHRSMYAIENTVLETVKAYNSLVQSDERLILSEDMIKTHEENLITAKEKEEISGEVLETYQVSSKLNFMIDRYIEEKDIKDSGIALFEKYVGIEPKGKICRPVMDESLIPGNIDSLIKKAVLSNHRILEQIEKIKIQREKISQYDATFLPSLNIELKASYDDDLEISENGVVEDQYARLNLNWNLFNGNRDKIRSEQESIFLQEQKKTLTEITNDVIKEIKSLFSKFNKNKQRVEALKKYVEANANIVDVYKSEFDAGTRTFVDILDAESELYNSSRTLINVEQAAINNYYDLLFNLSILSDSILRQENQNCATVEPRKIYFKPTQTDNKMDDDLDSLISESDSSIISKELGLDDNEKKETISSDIKTETTNLSFKQVEKLDFLNADTKSYTINLRTTKDLSTAKNFISKNNLGDDAYSFAYGKELKNAKVLYGIYPSLTKAKLAMKELSSNVLNNKPYIENISKYQALYNKYN